MNPSIPASQLVNILPGVLGAGGNPLSLNSIFLTENTAIPIGTVQPFSTLAAVGAFFGATSQEYLLAQVYFSGFTGSNQLPGTLYFAQYNAAAVSAYVRGANISAMTLTQLQALSGIITIVIDGRTVTSPSINLSSTTSFSNAAALIQSGLQTAGSIFSGTGTVAGTSTLTINSTVTGQLHVGDTVVGTDIPINTTILSFGTYTTLAGTGTVNMSASATGSAGPETVTVTSAATCTYDSQRAAFLITSGTTDVSSTIAFPTTDSFVTGLALTSATGAVLSQGAAIAVPATLMNAITVITQNWVTFMTTVEMPLSVKQQFAAWVNGANQQYKYVCQDSDVTALAPDATGSFGFLVKTFTGITSIWDPTSLIAAWNCGATASIDFEETNGRITFAYKGQAGLVATITDPTVANNLIANGYNFYGAYGTRNQSFINYQPGQISGGWLWDDSYVNQIQLNAALQLAFMELETNVKSLPYINQGYNLVRSAAADPINSAINFGSIVAGTTLSAAQIAEVNTAAGLRISDAIQQQGWYLQIQNASAIIQGQRGSPPMTLWYADGNSIQKITLASIDIL